LAREVMSVLSWLRQRRIEEGTYGVSTCYPGRIGPGPHVQNIAEDFELRFLPNLEHPKAKLGLALYREALNMHRSPFRLLAFWKLISLLFHDGKPDQQLWIENALDRVRSNSARTRVEELRIQGW